MEILMVALKVNIFLIKSFSPSPFKGRESTHKIKLLHEFLSLLPHPNSLPVPCLPSTATPHSTARIWLPHPPGHGRSHGASDTLPRFPPSPQPQLQRGSEGLINHKAINSPSKGQITDTDIQQPPLFHARAFL